MVLMLRVNRKRLFWFALAGLVLLAMTVAAGSPMQFILQVQNAGSNIATFVNYGVLNCSTGMSCSASGSTVTLTATGSGGVTSVTFTGDGTVLSSTPSSAVTTTGTVTAALATAPGGTVLDNNTTGTAAPTYTFAPRFGAAGVGTGVATFAGTTSGSGTFGCTGATCLSFTSSIGLVVSTGSLSAPKYLTSTNCQLGGAAGTTSPAACSSAPVGMIAIPASQTTYTVNSTQVTANSEIVIQQVADNSGLPSSPACNATPTNPMVSARVAATSFTFTLTTNGAVTCYHYTITN
jgi:hypothetical protein